MKRSARASACAKMASSKGTDYLVVCVSPPVMIVPLPLRTYPRVDCAGTAHPGICCSEKWRSELVRRGVEEAGKGTHHITVLPRVSVSRAVKPLVEDARPPDYFSQKVHTVCTHM